MSESKEVSIHEEIMTRVPVYATAMGGSVSDAEKLAHVALTAIGNNPALALADRRSLLSAVRRAAEDGLVPDGRQGAFVIYKTKVKLPNGQEKWIDKVQWMPMIYGLRLRVRRSAELSMWDVGIVREGDEFDYALGEDPHLHHKPKLGNSSAPILGAYSIARFKDGTKSFEVMDKHQIDKVRAISRAKDGEAWTKWYEEMAKKTVARRHFKVLPADEQVIRSFDRNVVEEDDEDEQLEAPRERPQLSHFMPPVDLDEIKVPPVQEAVSEKLSTEERE